LHAAEHLFDELPHGGVRAGRVAFVAHPCRNHVDAVCLAAEASATHKKSGGSAVVRGRNADDEQARIPVHALAMRELALKRARVDYGDAVRLRWR
jgi:hypothetical protein